MCEDSVHIYVLIPSRLTVQAAVLQVKSHVFKFHDTINFFFFAFLFFLVTYKNYRDLKFEKFPIFSFWDDFQHIYSKQSHLPSASAVFLQASQI